MRAPVIQQKFNAKDLIIFSSEILKLAGLEAGKCDIVAETLVEADLMSHTTHGLQLLAAYVTEIEKGGMNASGQPEIINDFGSSVTWNGKYLAGPWLVHQAIELALERINQHPVVTIVIQKSHHIACLAAYLEKVTSKGYLIMLSCSDPRNKTVAPFGGTTGVYSPNPLAAGIPTQSQPILLDVSMSATANALVKRCYDQDKKLPHPWLLTANGEITDDPATFFEDPPSTILPLGGLDTGYKGYALGLLVEALTNALGGYGRKDNPSKWTASVFIQVINPGAFGGGDAFKLETDYLAEACKKSPSIDNGVNVRLPGSNALLIKTEQLENGVNLSEGIISSLNVLSTKYSVKLPDTL